jgi:IS30 family transposase
MSNPPARRLTPDEVDQIVELRLAGVPVRAVAREVNTSPKTVQRRWHQYLRASAKERAEALAETREEIVQRFTQLADSARREANAALEVGDQSGAVKWSEQERHALRELARVQGLDVATINLTGGTDNTLEVVWRDEIVSPGE